MISVGAVAVLGIAASVYLTTAPSSSSEHTITNPRASVGASSDIGLNARNWKTLSCPNGFDSSDPTPGRHYSKGSCTVTTTSGSIHTCSQVAVVVARDGSSTVTLDSCTRRSGAEETATETRDAGEESAKPEQPPVLATFSCPPRPGTNEVHPSPGIGCATALRLAKLCVLHRVSATGWTCSFRPYETNGAVLAVVRQTGNPQETINVYDGAWGE
jgi:hypothetical protein